jgi:hypothetical protein
MTISLRDVTATQQALTVEEATGLTLAALDRVSTAPTGQGLPALDDILLDARGRLSFRAPGAEAADRELVTQLGLLLQRLLQLEIPGAASPGVPGALLVLIARATGTLDLPRPSPGELRESLRRFGSPDPTRLAGIHRRHAAGARTTPADAPLRRRAAAAASLVLSVLALIWTMNPATRDSREEPGVRITHETITAAPPTRVPSGARPAARAISGTPVMAGPLLSARAVGTDLFSPSFSGDGGQLLFHAGRTGSPLLRASFSDGRPAITTLLHDGAANYHVTQSPDGRWLAFDSDRDGTRGVYVAASDFTDALAARRISGPGYAAIPRWSPDGRRLAFVKAEPRRPRVWNVWVADLEQDTQTRVSDHRVGQAWGASWFASGDRLAYSVEDRLVIVDLDRGTRHVVPSPRRGHLVRTPAVSPDGRWIVFQVHRDGVWLFDTSSGRPQRVLGDRTAEEFTWAPDGSRVIYHTRRPDGWSLWQFTLAAGA